ncbi:hypothetical protein [Methanoplanus limicola]|uniref:Uncharacterized protein n=1 Tax=Methanoplanus limicola DSM 2279 TaxID=937775 RepID=H1YWK5_9EURY|nr:hypothetical protein [Methanoplanus limicola]EHQ35807.1 hypothetical protein Metlim_1706 [Methanoplanus limicola DSM 2279]
MKKKVALKTESLGADDIKNPDIKELSSWISDQRRTSCDLITYKIEALLKSQNNIDSPCTGGIFYRKRIEESIDGLKCGFLRSEPAPLKEDLIYDANRASKIRKRAHMALPSPMSLGIEDVYYKDHEEFLSSLCDIYSKIMREQRDAGISGHVIIADRFSRFELEELSKYRTSFFSPSANASILSLILEYRQNIVIYPNKIPVLTEIMNEYEVKSLTVVDGKKNDFKELMNHFDPENIISGGFEKPGNPDYWKKISEFSEFEL